MASFYFGRGSRARNRRRSISAKISHFNRLSLEQLETRVVPAGHLAVTLTGPTSGSINESLPYSAVAVNDGDSDLTNVDLFIIAGNLTVTSATATPGVNASFFGTRADGRIDVLAPGQTIRLDITARPNSDQGGKVYQIISNDEASQTLKIHGAALVVDLTASPPINSIGAFSEQHLQTGQLVTYTATLLANRGPDAATNVNLGLTLDFLTQLSFVSANLNGQPIQVTPNSRQSISVPIGTVNVGNLAEPQVLSATYRVLNPDLIGTNVAASATSDLPRTGADNFVSTRIRVLSDRFVVSAPSNIAVGAPFDLTVAVVNAQGNPDTSYRGLVSFSSLDQAAVLPSTYTFTAADQGVHTFRNVVLNTPGAQTITARETLLGPLPPTAIAATVTVASTPTDANATYVQQLYQDLLGRAADPGGVAFWSASIQRDGRRDRVALEIEQTSEYRARLVQTLYASLLGRQADPGGLAFCVGSFQLGATLAMVEALLLGSDEYLQKRGGGDTGAFLNALYQDVLGRPIDESGKAFWTGQLFNVSRTQVASIILTSGEGFAHLVRQTYVQYLGRPGDAGGIGFFVGGLSLGGRYEAVVAQLIASDEYFNRPFADRQAPVVVVQSPANGTVFNVNPLISGRITDNMTGVARLQRQINLGVWTDVPVDASGNFSFTPTFELDGSADNTHFYRFLASDRAGNVLRTGDFSFTLDTLIPSPPQPPRLLPASDTGASQTDRLTNLAAPTFLVDIKAGQRARLYVDGQQVAEAGGVGPVRLTPDLLADGVHEIQATLVDAAGNESFFSDPVSVTIDTAAPTPSTPRLLATSDAGLSQTDNITNVTSPVVIVDHAPGEIVRLFVDGQPFGSPTGSGQVLFTIGPLADGVHTIRATVQDAAGNVSANSTILSVTIDTVGPAVPVFDLTNATDSGALGDQKTNAASVGLVGTSSAGTRIDVLQTGDGITTATSGFTITNVALRPGDNALTLRATDVAGNQSWFSRVITREQVGANILDQALQVYQSILNEVSFVPYGGLQKGAQATAETRAGNDWDQAALLISRLAPLGAVGRFVQGRASAPDTLLARWLGVSTTTAAGIVLGTAGYHPVYSANVADNIEFDHVWVEADIPLPQGGTRTVQLDPSWKFKEFQTGISGMLTSVPFDMDGYLSQVRLEPVSEYYRNQVAAYLRSNDPTHSLADVPHDGNIVAAYSNALPTELPYEVVGTPQELTAAPSSMTQRALLTLKSGNTVLWTNSVALPEIALQQITIGSADGGAGQVAPQLRIAGQVVRTGQSVSKGTNLDLQVDSLEPGDDTIDRTFHSTLVAGDYAAVGLDVNQFSLTGLARMQAAVNQAAYTALAGQSVTTEEQVGNFLGLSISKWFFEWESDRQFLNGLTGAVAAHQGLEFGVATSTTTVGYYADLQIPYVPTAAAVDIPGTVGDSIAIDGDTSRDEERFRLIGLNGSSQESALWEELINTPSISTVKSLQLAGSAGIPVFKIDQSNKASLLPQLTLSASDVADISEAIDAGATVTTPRDPTPLRSWQGVGYLADFGSNVSYLISGGLRADQHHVLHGGFASGTPTNPTLPPKGTPDQNQATVGDPVNLANGNLVHDETDIALPGIGLALRFARHYDSQSTVNVGMGTGWMHSYADFLNFNSDSTITWNTSEGYRYTFLPSAGSYSVPDSLHGTFQAKAGGYVYRNKDGLTHTFDAVGRLKEIRDRNDNALTITHVGSSNQIGSVIESNAPTRSLTFTYSGGLLTSVADFTGRNWLYAYSAGRLAGFTGPGDASAAPATVAYAYFTDAARSGLLSTITMADGGIFSYSYYPNRRVFQIDGPEEWHDTFAYNLYRLKTIYVDSRGVSQGYVYNELGNQLAVINSDYTQTTKIWQNSLPQSVTDTFGNTTTLQYDALGNVTKQIDANGISTDFTYESTFSRMTSMSRAGGRVTQYAYDARGNMTKLTDPLNGQTTYTYDAHGQIISRTTPNGNLTALAGDFTATTTYNDAGQVIQVSTDLPTTETNTYDSRGNLTQHIDAKGNSTSYVYDVRNRLIQTTDALGQVATQSFDVMGNMIAMTDVLSRTTVMTYDKLQRLVKTVFPDGTSESIRYDEIGNQIAMADELGHVTHFQFDFENRQVQTIFADGTSSRTLYNSEGRVEATISAAGNAEAFVYDSLWRTTEHNFVQSDGTPGSRMLFGYDDVGNRERVTDALGHSTRYGYDLLNRNTTITDANGGVSSFQFDADSRLTALTDSSQNRTAFGYDVLGRQTSRTDPHLQIQTDQFDAVGNRTAEVDRNGRKRVFAFDALNRLTDETWLNASGSPVRTISYDYDAAGQLTEASDPDSALAFTYDTRGRVKTVSNAGTPHAPIVIISYAYDAAGNLVSSSDSINGATHGLNAYAYDELNRMVRILQTGTALVDKRVDLAYTADNLIQQITRSADVRGSQIVAATTYTRDFMNRLTGLINVHDSSTLTSEDLAYDAAGRITQVATDLSTTAYTYDPIDQVVVTSNTVTAGQNGLYQYDLTGNRQFAAGQTVTTGTGNQLASNGTFNYSYDANGNLIRREEMATGNIREFQWDYRNRLGSVIDKNAAGVTLARTDYTYDVLDRRIAKLVDTNSQDSIPTQTTQFVYDGSNVLSEFSGSDPQVSKPSMHYLYGPAVDQVMAQDAGASQMNWLLSDHLGSITGVVDSSGSLVNRLTYDAFGNTVSQSNAGPGSRYGFAGRELDAETGLYFNRLRYYDPANGRFLSQDPLGFGGRDANLYRYGTNNPVSNVDPTGTESQNPCSTTPVYPTSVARTNNFEIRIVRSAEAELIFGIKAVTYKIREKLADGYGAEIKITQYGLSVGVGAGFGWGGSSTFNEFTTSQPMALDSFRNRFTTFGDGPALSLSPFIDTGEAGNTRTIMHVGGRDGENIRMNVEGSGFGINLFSIGFSVFK